MSQVGRRASKLCSKEGAEFVADIEQIEDRRPMNKEMDAIYILSPLPYVVDCLMADFDRRRYRKAFLIWTSGVSAFKHGAGSLRYRC